MLELAITMNRKTNEYCGIIIQDHDIYIEAPPSLCPRLASAARITYAGSVNAADCDAILKFVGGVSLKGPEFVTICNAITSKKVAA
uniref:Uncharacterized protein n=1 Tax=Physcomitrium patens TaxID=3218 RepID=A0A2K1IQM1_PHYPA|nr:hypothetical protein PHYPA_025679 [Physcomitrium patens]